MSQQRDLPRLERGKDLSRIFAFTDGVFAIAITLLVLQIEVPVGVADDSSLWEALREEGPDLLAFGLSFLVIGMYWVGSHRFMRTVEEYDAGLMKITLIYLAFVVLVPFTSQLMGEYAGTAPTSMSIYILNLVCVALVSAWMQKHVLRAKLGKPEYDWDTELNMKSSLFTAGLMLATAPCALLLGPYTPFLWFFLRFDPYERQREKVYADADDAATESKSGRRPA